MSTDVTIRTFRARPSLVAGMLASLLAVACGGGSVNGTGGTPPASGPDIQLASKLNLGNYLISANGDTLYYFGFDLPGAAGQSPVSNCTGGCVSVWPVFHVDTPTLASGLQASDFGEFTRPDGAAQTTFRGFPLYHYAGDSKAGDTNGDNFDGWYVIRDPFYSLMVLTKSFTGASLYLTDPSGRSLYAFAHDTVGTASAPPVEACVGACVTNWPIFLGSGTATPTGVDSTRLTTFVRADGQTQSAFDGHPLYYFANDTLPGDTKGEGAQGLFHLLDQTGTPN